MQPSTGRRLWTLSLCHERAARRCHSVTESRLARRRRSPCQEAVEKSRTLSSPLGSAAARGTARYGIAAFVGAKRTHDCCARARGTRTKPPAARERPVPSRSPRRPAQLRHNLDKGPAERPLVEADRVDDRRARARATFTTGCEACSSTCARDHSASQRVRPSAADRGGSLLSPPVRSGRPRRISRSRAGRARGPGAGEAGQGRGDGG